MTIKTGNTIKDDVLKAFQRKYRNAMKTGGRTVVPDLLAEAIRETEGNHYRDERSVREVCRRDDPELLAWCEKIALSQQKSYKVAQIRKTNAAVLVNSFLQTCGLNCTYYLADSYVGIVFYLPNNQSLRIRLSYKKLEADDYQEVIMRAVSAIAELTNKFGRVTLKWF